MKYISTTESPEKSVSSSKALQRFLGLTRNSKKTTLAQRQKAYRLNLMQKFVKNK